MKYKLFQLNELGSFIHVNTADQAGVQTELNGTYLKVSFKVDGGVQFLFYLEFSSFSVQNVYLFEQIQTPYVSSPLKNHL